MARKINLGHFAFYRGWLEGLDLADMGDRYLPTGRDLPEAKKTLRWLQDELVAAAKRARPALARILKLTPTQLKSLTSPLPASDFPAHLTLEDFQADVDPEAFYTEAELLALFQERYKETQDPELFRKAERNARLLAKLRETITWLEGWVAVAPQGEDPVDSWLNDALANRLKRQGAETLRDVVRLIERHGPTWFRRVEKIGPVGAQRLQRWLEENQLMSPVAAKALVCAYVPPASMGIVPLERLLMPDELSGRTGVNRQASPTLEAQDDFGAIQTWLMTLPMNQNTQRSYRCQVERFLLWMVFERGKALSSATTEDCVAYREFLDVLEPGRLWFWKTRRDDWVGTRARPRTSEDWRPFAGPLAPTSQRLALTILTGLFEWLCRQRYLQVNPWDAVPPKQAQEFVIRTDHSLTEAQWAHCLRCLKTLPKDEKYYRLWALTNLAQLLGLRLSELASIAVAKPARAGRVSPGLKPGSSSKQWVLDVVGKGHKIRRVIVEGPALLAVEAYGRAQGLPDRLDEWPPGTHLFNTLGGGSWRANPDGGDARQPLSHSQVYRTLKAFFKWAASKASSPRDAAHLNEASTHWLRHTNATLAIEAAISKQDVQELLGHSSGDVTDLYIHTQDSQKAAALRKLAAYVSAQGPDD